MRNACGNISAQEYGYAGVCAGILVRRGGYAGVCAAALVRRGAAPATPLLFMTLKEAKEQYT